MMTTSHHRGHWPAKTTGVTLVELMVVMAMTAVLSALLLPALSTAKEKSRRAICQNNLAQFFLVVREFADENEDFLPSCADNRGYYHSIVLSDAVFTNLVDMSGGNSNIYYCPNIVFSSGPNSVSQHGPYGYVIGYNYLADSISASSKGPDYTVQPVKWPATSTNELLADANYWTPGGTSSDYFPAQMKVAPHTPMGAAMARNSTFTVGLAGNSSASIGAMGGNVGFVDGHVAWRSMTRMQTNTASAPSSLSDAYGTW